jgi:hypothetical protein
VKKQQAIPVQVISRLMERQEIPQEADAIRLMRDEDVIDFSIFLLLMLY